MAPNLTNFDLTFFFQVSTMRENFPSNEKNHVIIFYCGPSDNRGLMLKIGQNILDHIKYKNTDGRLMYKADVADDLPFGSRAVMIRSMKANSKYSISVPRY